MIEKLRDCFEEMVVYKDLKNTSFFSTLRLPSFLRDWLLKRFSDDEGNLDMDGLIYFVHTYLPNKEEWLKIKDQIINDSERIQILTKITVDISIKTGEVTFALPDFGLMNNETTIDPYTWERCREELVTGREVWGVVELGYRPPNDDVKPKIPGKIRLTSFTNFCPYTIDLDYYKDVRNEFTTSEWIDVLLGAIDYNGSGYDSEDQKLTMLARLLPFVEKNLNLIELAPKETGKSYVFGHISKYGFLADGGKVTRAKMFYDAARKTPGFITGNDFVAIDEVKLVQFSDENEMRAILQGYMQYGSAKIGGYEVKSDAGIVFLGNIAQDNMNVSQNMFSELPPLFQESALVDRIHGFIKGWDIPKMHDGLKMSGWALNSEYFCTILHELRDDLSYRAIVDQMVEVPEDAKSRDSDAIKLITTAYLKLLFPNVRSVQDVNPKRFQKYCLQPAIQMRRIIKKQLAILDKEYRDDVPFLKLKEIPDES